MNGLNQGVSVRNISDHPCEGSSENNCCRWLTTWAKVVFRIKWIVFVIPWCYNSGLLKGIGRLTTLTFGIQVIKEVKENGKLPFLDCLVSNDNNELWMKMWRKPKHTNRLLDKSPGSTQLHTKPWLQSLWQDECNYKNVVCDTRDSWCNKTNTLNLFFTRTTATLTLLDETFTNLPKLMQQTGTQHLLLLYSTALKYYRGFAVDDSQINTAFSPRQWCSMLKFYCGFT